MQKSRQLQLEAGADIDAKNKDGNTALILAEGNGRTEIVRVLLEAGADVHARSDGGWTTMMWTAGNNGNLEVILILLNADTDAKAKK